MMNSNSKGRSTAAGPGFGANRHRVVGSPTPPVENRTDRISPRRSWAILLACWALLLLGAAPPAGAQQKPSAFQAWFERELDQATALPRDALDGAQRFRYVFVAGFLNEGLRLAYFNENRRTLIEAGVPADAIHILFPGSERTPEENIAELGRSIPRLAAAGPQPLVLIGHSKGAVELLGFALSSPEFVRDRVRAIFLVQGAFGGSGVADYIKGKGHPLDGRMPPARRAAFELAARGGRLLDARIGRGFESLTHDYAARLWNRLLPPSAAAPGVPSDKVFFIRSHRRPADVSTAVTITAAYLEAYYGPNDGMVVVDDQWIPGAGRLLATLDADHAALTVAWPISDRSAATRRAFTNALLMQLSGAFDRASDSFPEAIYLRGRTASFNSTYYSVLRNGQIWVKPIRPASPDRARWTPVPNPPGAEGPLLELSSDDEYIVAIDSGRRVHTLLNTHQSPASFSWNSAWGTPGKPRWRGPGVRLPADSLGWDVSYLSPREDGELRDPRVPQAAYWIGSGVTTVYTLNRDKTDSIGQEPGQGRRITFLDPWLPPDESQEVCGPKRGRFEAVALSASGSTIFVMNRYGDMFTRVFDFDISGGDNIFFRYSYQAQSRALMNGVAMPYVGGKLSPVARQMPPPDWVRQAKIPATGAAGGRITAHISIAKVGRGGLHRVLRVAGANQAGERGFFYKDITGATWQFRRTADPLAAAAASGPFIDNTPDDRSDVTISAQSDDQTYHAAVDGVPIEVTDFNPYCSPARVRFLFAEGVFEARLHTARLYSSAARAARGLSAAPIAYQGSLEIARPIPAYARRLLERFETGFNDVDVSATAAGLVISGRLWSWPLSK